MDGKAHLEELNKRLCSKDEHEAYKAPLDAYRVSFLPRVLGALLVTSGNIVYGARPSYLKFRAVEVIARVPYQSWETAAFTLLTLFYGNEERALKYTHLSEFSRIAQDNETMHVVVISKLAREEQKAGFFRFYLIPILFSFAYFWVSYLLYFINRRYSLELNYCFEQHAYDQYNEFLTRHEDTLKEKPVMSEFLTWYGRFPISQYDFFVSIRNDELIHRNVSIHEIRQK